MPPPSSPCPHLRAPYHHSVFFDPHHLAVLQVQAVTRSRIVVHLGACRRVWQAWTGGCMHACVCGEEGVGGRAWAGREQAWQVLGATQQQLATALTHKDVGVRRLYNLGAKWRRHLPPVRPHALQQQLATAAVGDSSSWRQQQLATAAAVAASSSGSSWWQQLVCQQQQQQPAARSARTTPTPPPPHGPQEIKKARKKERKKERKKRRRARLGVVL